MYQFSPAGPSRRPRRRGAAAVEFLLILPLLLALVLGCIDFGRFAYTYIAVANAARAGAGYGIMNPYLPSDQPAWATQIQETARDEMNQQIGYVRTSLAVTATAIPEKDAGGTLTGRQRVRVDASYPFQTLIPWPFLPSSVTLRQVVGLRADSCVGG